MEFKEEFFIWIVLRIMVFRFFIHAEFEWMVVMDSKGLNFIAKRDPG